MCDFMKGDQVEFRSGYTERLGVVEDVYASVGPEGIDYLSISSVGNLYLRRADQVVLFVSAKDQEILRQRTNLHAAEARVRELTQIKDTLTKERDAANEEAGKQQQAAEDWNFCYRMASSRVAMNEQAVILEAQKAGSLQDQIDRLAKHFNLPETGGAEEIVNDLIDAYPTPRLTALLCGFKDSDGDIWVEGADGKFRMGDETSSDAGWSLLTVHRCFGPLKAV